MAIDLLYFSWVREAIGTGSETLDPPEGLASVSDLVDWLATRSEGHARAFADRARLRAAVDQVFVPLDAPLGRRARGRDLSTGDRGMIRVRSRTSQSTSAAKSASLRARALAGSRPLQAWSAPMTASARSSWNIIRARRGCASHPGGRGGGALEPRRRRHHPPRRGDASRATWSYSSVPPPFTGPRRSNPAPI